MTYSPVPDNRGRGGGGGGGFINKRRVCITASGKTNHGAFRTINILIRHR